MNIITFRPDRWENWCKMHWHFHSEGSLGMQLTTKLGVKVHGHVVACHPELLAFSILLDGQPPEKE